MAALIDTRDAVAPALVEGAKKRGLRVILGGEVFATHGKTLTAIDVRAGGERERLEVDGLAMSSGFSPNVHLSCHHGGKPQWREDIGRVRPRRTARRA